MSGKIAIVGVACRFPGAPDLDAYADLLFSGRDAVTEIPDERWSKAYFLDSDLRQPGKSYTFAAGVLDGIDLFDAGFFGVSPREAANIDPQQRLALELAYEAMEDGGFRPERLAGGDAGVFIGASAFDYVTQRSGDPSVMDAHSMSGMALSSVSNRISYAFDLKGPSFTVDTACSSSMVALHLACESLARGEAPLAFAGGVNLLITPQPFVGFSRAGMLSPRGRCHAFDSRADGYVRAEGGAILILKPLDAALADGDPIRGIVRASGVNSDGRTTGLSLPSREGQAKLLREVYARAEVEPDDLSYLEAHGTGTPVGDPIEAGAIADALSARRRAPLPIGSAKTNVGHLEAASGMAGVLKALLTLDRGEAPPTLNLVTPNPDIPFDAHKLCLTRAVTPIGAGRHGRVAGVNSFGFGGTNAHVVLQQAPVATGSAEVGTGRPPLLISARDEDALGALVRTWREKLASAASPEAAAALIRGAARRRGHHPHRLAFAGSVAEILAALDAWLGGDASAASASGQAVDGRVAFVFSGNGSQWADMGRTAYERSARFRSALLAVDRLLEPLLGWSAAQRIAEGLSPADLADTAVAQPTLFALQVASVDALKAAGVIADAFAGHSVGEVAAAWASGALSIEQACQVVAHRSRLQGLTRGRGGMAALGLSAEAARDALADLALELEVAAVNSPGSVTVSGSEADLEVLGRHARARRWLFSRLALDYAFHSPAMDSIREELFASLRDLKPAAPARLFVSTVVGGLTQVDLDADYWWRNIREPVLFAQGLDALRELGVRRFIEIGPQPILQSYVRESLKSAHAPGRSLGTLAKSDPPDRDPFTSIAARAYVAGVDISGAEAFDGPAEIRALPRYPWTRQSYWVERTGEGVELNALAGGHELLGFQHRASDDAWFNHLSTGRQPWLVDHQVDGAVVLPAAAMLEMAFAAARARHPEARALEVRDLEIGRPMLLDGGAREVRFSVSGDGVFTLKSRPRLSEETFTVHAKGRLTGAGEQPRLSLEPGDGPAAEFGPEAFYERTRRMRLQYGPAFQTVARARVVGSDYAEATFASGFAGGPVDPLLDPTLLDGALQALATFYDPEAGEAAAVPWRFGRVRLLQPGVRPAKARVRVRTKGPRSVRADLLLVDVQDRAVAELTDCWFIGVDMRRGAAQRERRFWTASIPTLDQPPRPAPAGLADAALAAVPRAQKPPSVLLGDAFVLASYQEVLVELVGDVSRPFAPDLLALQGRVATAALPSLDVMIAALAREGVLTPAGEGWRFDPEGLLPDASSIWRTLMDEAPQSIAELALAASRAATLAQAVRQGGSAAPPASAELRGQMLLGGPSARAALDGLWAALGSTLQAWPRRRPIRVAWIGAFDGGLLEALGDRLAAAGPPARLSVLLTETADADQAREALAGHAGAAALEWAGRREGRYDLVVGVQPFGGSAAHDPAEVARLLAPGGVLLATEPTADGLWPLAADEAASNGRGSIASALQASGLRLRSVPLHGETWSSELFVGEQNAEVGTQPRRASAVTVFAGPEDDGATAFAFAMADRGRSVSTHPFEDLAAALASPEADDQEHVVFAPTGIAADASALSRLCAAVAGAAARAKAGTRVRLVAANGVANAVEALRRVVANEAPGLDCRTIALDASLTGAEAVERLAAELESESVEKAIKHTAQGRFASRLRLGPERRPVALRGPRRLDIGRPGLMSSLAWTPIQPRAPGPGEVAIEVRAAGLNFRDVMWAAGLLPDEALLHGFAGPGFGLECAGVVTAVGEGVEDLSPGSRVVAVAPEALATHAVTKRHAVLAIPAEIDFEAAATLPVAFLTAVYSLGRLARLERGERVLVHGGAGGVGLAAIQYAQRLGAQVFATAGSPVKRELLRRLGVDHVFDSRSAAFADDVLAATAGEGVDVVLNSLSDELMQQSLRLLRPFGRFVEIGKRDLFGDTAVGLRPLRHNAAYFAVDVDQLASLKPAVAQALFQEIEGLLAEGALRPLPHRTFGFDAVTDAFRLMQGSGHIGKVVLTPEADSPVAPPAASEPFRADADGVYVVSGGLGGFGLETARWIARQGARRLALLSRRGPEDPAAAQVIAEFAALGVDAQVHACDVAERSALDDVLRRIRAAGPVVGVLHAAAVIEDGLLAGLDAERFERVLRPKAQGAANFDALTRTDPVGLFLVHSSISTAIGNPGQAAYVAANAAAEAVVQQRRAEGLPGLAVRWGPIADAGYLEREARVKEMLDAVLGGGELTARSALDALPDLMASGTETPGFADVDWSTLRRQLPLGATDLFADMPAANAIDAGAGALRDRLSGLSEDEAQALILDVLVEETAAILRLPRNRIDVQQPLADIGCDSLMAVELRLAIEARLGGELPLLSVSDGASLDSLAQRIVQSVRGRAELGDAALTDQLLRHEGSEQADALTRTAAK